MTLLSSPRYPLPGLDLNVPYPVRSFVLNQSVASLCYGTAPGEVGCFSCFYLFRERDATLLFKSNPASAHYRQLKPGVKLAGTIVSNNTDRDGFCGIQLTGLLREDDHFAAMEAGIHYHHKLPLASGIPGVVFTLELTTIRYSLLQSGSLSKIRWARGESSSNDR